MTLIAFLSLSLAWTTLWLTEPTHFKVREIILDILCFNLLCEQVSLVEKQDDRDRPETPVIDDCVKNVDAFLEPIGDAVFKQCLVESTRSYEKEDRRYFIETLEPFLPLWSLPSYIDESEWDTLNINDIFVNSTGSFSRMKNVFFWWNIALCGCGEGEREREREREMREYTRFETRI